MNEKIMQEAAQAAGYADGILIDLALVQRIEKHGRNADAPIADYIRTIKQILATG